MTDEQQQGAATCSAFIDGLLELADDQLTFIKLQHEDLMRVTEWQQGQLNVLYEMLRRPQVVQK